MWKTVVCLCLLSATERSFSLDVSVLNEPKVGINDGKLSGIWKISRSGTRFAAFEGIPYAKPPVGALRFKDPVPAESWSDEKKAWNVGPKCLQYDAIETPQVQGSEDCLYLNVYTPNTNITMLPVLFHIHPGAFMFGAGDMFGPELIISRNLIVVTMNYRLGPLGFLTTGDSVVPGNMGLKDQALALKWVSKNINKFGGDPKNVTIMGMSAGGSSVQYHMLSPMSKGLFVRAISESGSAMQPWAQSHNATEKGRRLAEHLGCPKASSTDMIKCLRSVNAEDIVYGQTIFMTWHIRMFGVFLPGPEPANSKNPFLTDHPYHLVKEGKAAKVPYMTTVTGAEGLYPAALYQRNAAMNFAQLENEWTRLSANIFIYEDTLPNKTTFAEVGAKIKNYYFKDNPISQATFPQLVQALSDRHFFIDMARSAFMHANTTGQPVYVYKYNFRGAYSLSNAYAQDMNDYGVSHADDAFHIGNYANFEPIRHDDVAMSNILIDFIYSFICTGTPKSGNVVWEPVSLDADMLDYLIIDDPTTLRMASSHDFGNKNFWLSLGLMENERLNSTRSSAVVLFSSVVMVVSCLLVLLF